MGPRPSESQFFFLRKSSNRGIFSRFVVKDFVQRTCADLRGVCLVEVYRLACACGEAIPVAVGRAGGEIDCPGCGRRLAIPTLRHLRHLPPLDNFEDSATAAAASPLQEGGRRRGEGDTTPRSGGPWENTARGQSYKGSRRQWGRAEAVLVAGAFVAIASLLVAAWLMRPVTTGIDTAAIRAAVERVPLKDIYRAWRSFADSGVSRGPTPDEERVRRITKNRGSVAVAIGLLGGIGGLAAVGAAAAIVARGVVPRGEIRASGDRDLPVRRGA